MELLKELLLVTVAVASILVLIGIAGKLLNLTPGQNEFYLKGDNHKIVVKIADLIYKCFTENEGKRGSILCFEVKVESNQAIASSEILGAINPLKFDRQRVVLPEMIQINSTIIRYQDELVYVEIIEGERIGS